MNEIIIKTPMGTLKAYYTGDADYPGIHIELDDQPVATVEHDKNKGLRTLTWIEGQEDFNSEVIWAAVKKEDV